jgi:hypothetical protein
LTWCRLETYSAASAAKGRARAQRNHRALLKTHSAH